MNPRLIIVIFSGTILGCAAICGLLFWLLSNGDKAARQASTQFIEALVRDGAPPKGASGYVRGVREAFGDVARGRVIDARNHSVGHGQSSRTYYVADVLLQTERGPAVVELSFDSPSLTYSSERVTGVVELAPRDVPDDALSDADFTALAKAFDARGGKPAGDITLSGAFLEDVESVATPAATVEAVRPPAGQRQAMKQLRCVQAAKGDIEKLQRCVPSAG
jgi:hypothetical protein